MKKSTWCRPCFRTKVNAARRHEAQRPVDLRGDALVALPLDRGGDELLVPQVHLREVGETTLGEGTQQVQRRGRLLVGRHEPLRVRQARLGFERLVVDHVAAERGQLGLAHPFHLGRARLGELAGDAAHLHHRHPGRVGEGDGHLQDDLELVPDGVGRVLGEGLGAVAGLEEKGLAVGHLAQLARQVASLAGEHQRRQRGQRGLGLLERIRVGPVRLLGCRELPPGRGAPRGGRGLARHRTRLTP